LDDGDEVHLSFNPARIDLCSVRLVVLCADHGSLSAAATHGNMSVSGASHRLHLLENALGCRVFDRHRRGLCVTEHGRAVVSLCRLILEQTEKVIRSIRD